MYLLSALAWALIFSGENVPILGPSKKELQLASWRAKPKSSEGSVCAHAASGKPASPPRLLPAQEPVFVLHLYLGLKECAFSLSRKYPKSAAFFTETCSHSPGIRSHWGVRGLEKQLGFLHCPIPGRCGSNQESVDIFTPLEPRTTGCLVVHGHLLSPPFVH